jgi:hypothetical protein
MPKKKDVNIYKGNWNDGDEFVTLNGVKFSHKPSLKLANHSPDGFSWGYSGSGPAQLAIAILFNETGDVNIATRFYQEFKMKYIAEFPMGQNFTLTGKQVAEFIQEKQDAQ